MTLGTAPTVSDLSLYIPDLKIKKKETALAEMASFVHRAGVVRERELLIELLRVRERVGTTGLGKGVAVPHARSVTVVMQRLVVARSLKGIDWAAPDDLPVTLIFMALAPAEWSEEAFHGLVARAAMAARLQRTRQRLLSAPSSAAVAAVLREVTA